MLQAHHVLLTVPLPAFLQGALVPLRGQWYLETHLWALCVLIAIGVSLIIDPPSRQN